MKNKKKLTKEAQAFIDKWCDKEESKDVMENELLAIMQNCFVWGGISKATKKADKSMQFTFEQWVKTNNAN